MENSTGKIICLFLFSVLSRIIPSRSTFGSILNYKHYFLPKTLSCHFPKFYHGSLFWPWRDLFWPRAYGQIRGNRWLLSPVWFNTNLACLTPPYMQTKVVSSSFLLSSTDSSKTSIPAAHPLQILHKIKPKAIPGKSNKFT